MRATFSSEECLRLHLVESGNRNGLGCSVVGIETGMVDEPTGMPR